MPRRIGRALRIRSAIYGEGNWQPSKRDASTGSAARLMLSIADKCQDCALFGHHSKSKLEKVQLLLCFFLVLTIIWITGWRIVKTPIYRVFLSSLVPPKKFQVQKITSEKKHPVFDSRDGSASKQVKEAGLLMLKL